MLFFKLLLLLVFGIIFYQDYKDRMVYWFVYPLIGVLGFLIQKEHIETKLIVLNSSVNLIIIATVLIVLWVYSKIVLKQPLNNGIGIGDILFFVFLCFCFSTISFVVLFVFSMLFSLLMHVVLKSNYTKSETIPLAGYMSLFFIIIYFFTFWTDCNFVFAY